MYCIDEGMAKRNNEPLNIQCLLIQEQGGSAEFSSLQQYHYHRYIELIYLLTGSVETWIGNKMYALSKGDFIIIYSGEPHTFRSDTSVSYIVVKLLPEILVTSEQTFNEYEYVLNFSNRTGERTRVIKGDTKIGTLMKNAYATFTQGKYCSELFVRADIINVCAHILNFWHNNGEITSFNSRLTAENVRTVNKITAYVKDTNGTVKTHEAATMCNLSDGYFSRIFKSLMGMTFTEYAKSVKIAEAERLLKCSDCSVTDIAQHLGYATASHFIEDFKKEKGISPKKYKML